uniref:NADH dehydrogenase subunit 2 n=1 Tax=Gotra octocincta TaxID=3029099 RepID=UPI0023D84004|nr:NADH dehydrogenase subunit 2 [Gotra octocincta]WDQ40351.1 NADH dehydrogenase subunit 2 [Gotra octocincta]
MKKSMFMKIYIIPSIIISPIFSLSCNSWFSIWMSLEFNLMTFIPFMIFFNKFFKEVSIKYFIIQAISSSMLLLSSNLMMIFNNYSQNLNFFIIMINIAVLIKLGAAPFHSWFIQLMNNLNWTNCLILSTWQKIIPLILIMYLNYPKLIFSTIIICSITGTLLGLNHQSIRIMLSYSSINHISWLLLNLMFSEWMLLIYFISYFIINLSMMMLFNMTKIYYLNQLFFLNNKLIKLCIIINLFALSGLPPSFGFIMKWMSLYYSMWQFNSLTILIILMLSILTFIYYMRLNIIFLMNFNLSNKLILLNKFFHFNSIYMLLLFFFTQSFNLWIMSFWMS